ITADFCSRLGIATRILPMTDDCVRTRVRTAEGWLDFQDYFVRQQCAPEVAAVAFEGAPQAAPLPEFIAALRDPALRAVVICPSNPLISIAPILAVPGVREALAECAAPVVAVSPIIGGRAVKGPTARMMAALGLEVTAAVVARHYGDLLDGYVLDAEDAAQAAVIDIPSIATQTLMRTLADREALARAVLGFTDTIAAAG
ncbi:MAG TPA: 2-phospho-L-lactate transferase CofD family protein, partial [Xanthobacteraceae bacterium]|nr:2-phospho-L-lactate transferase CofD family protein [Xanthobacteraceae bacterium]